jgi:exopolysaccharide production protein ExoZ
MFTSEKTETKKRIDSLDYLRGIAALSVMVYHYYSWTISEISLTGLTSKIGIYAVSIFYILSGLTLYNVYINNSELTVSNLKGFFIKRFFRIYPLLWLIILLTVFLTHEPLALKTLILNFTGLFGILDWGRYIGTGVWSIGNELAFYLMFPVFWYTIVKRKFLILVFILCVIFLWFAFFGLNSNEKLSVQWTMYVNPLNQVLLFIAGICIGKYSGRLEVPKAMIIFFLALISFILYPAQGINLVTGIDRIVLTLISVAICLGVFHLNRIQNTRIHDVFKWLGDCSYSIYLIHPVVYHVIINQSNIALVPLKFLLPLAVVGTFFASYVSFRFYEKKFVRIGAKIAENNKQVLPV